VKGGEIRNRFGALRPFQGVAKTAKKKQRKRDHQSLGQKKAVVGVKWPDWPRSTLFSVCPEGEKRYRTATQGGGTGTGGYRTARFPVRMGSSEEFVKNSLGGKPKLAKELLQFHRLRLRKMWLKTRRLKSQEGHQGTLRSSNLVGEGQNRNTS